MDGDVCKVDRMSLNDYFFEVIIIDSNRKVSVEVLSDLRHDGYKMLISSHRAEQDDIAKTVECARRFAEEYIQFIKSKR